VPLALSAPTSLMSFYGGVTLLGGAHIHTSFFFTRTRIILLIVVVISAVRSHNVALISKSYESYSDRFTTTVVEDLTTSDLSQAVKGACKSLLQILRLNRSQVSTPSSMSRLRSRMLPVRKSSSMCAFYTPDIPSLL